MCVLWMVLTTCWQVSEGTKTRQPSRTGVGNLWLTGQIRFRVWALAAVAFSDLLKALTFAATGKQVAAGSQCLPTSL